MGKSKHSEMTNGMQCVIKEIKVIWNMSRIFRMEPSKEIIMTFHKMFPLFCYYETKYWAEQIIRLNTLVLSLPPYYPKVSPE